MARTPVRPPKKKQPEAPKRRCRDCAHSYDWHNKALDGHLILCRCPHDAKSQHGKFCKFLSDPECDQFKERPIDKTDNAEAN